MEIFYRALAGAGVIVNLGRRLYTGYVENQWGGRNHKPLPDLPDIYNTKARCLLETLRNPQPSYDGDDSTPLFI